VSQPTLKYIHTYACTRTYTCAYLAARSLHFTSPSISINPRELSFVLRGTEKHNCFQHRGNKICNVRAGHYRYFDEIKRRRRNVSLLSRSFVHSFYRARVVGNCATIYILVFIKKKKKILILLNSIFTSADSNADRCAF